MTLVSSFNKTFKNNPDKIAIEFNDKKISFSELDKNSNKVANALIKLGVQKGDRVAQFLGNSIELVYFFLGALKAGCVVVPMNTSYKEVEVEYILNNSGSSFILTGNENLKILENCKEKLKTINKIITIGKNDNYTTFHDFINDSTGVDVNVKVTDEDGSIIFYTSGTTGKSKGAYLTHKNVESNLQALKEGWHLTEKDKLLLTLPLFHIHGLGVALCGSFYNGNSIVLRKKFISEEILTLIQEHKCTLFMGVPTMYIKILETKNKEKYDVSSMRLFVSGSAPLSSETFREFEKTFGHKIIERAGMSETMMNFSNPYWGERKPGTVGFPLKGVKVKIVDSQYNELGQGKEGEIFLKGPNVLKEYWNFPGLNGEAFRDGWFRTGDIGRIDKDNYLSIVGRLKDMIISGGLNIYPREVEEVIDQYPAVKESAVIGVPDNVFGESVKAFVVLRGNESATEEDIIKFCKDKIASYKKPKYVEFMKDLPRTSTGKVTKNVLKEMAMEVVVS